MTTEPGRLNAAHLEPVDSGAAIHSGAAAIPGLPSIPGLPEPSSPRPNVPPPANSLTMTCKEYIDLGDVDTQSAVIEEILKQEGSVLGPQQTEIAKTLADAVCQFLPTAPSARSSSGRPSVAASLPAMGETYESLAVDVDGHVAQVTLLGPGKGNAMGPAFWAELPSVFASLDADPGVRAIVLTGSGRNFSYGLDLAAMGDTLSPMLADGALARPRAEFHTRLRGCSSRSPRSRTAAPRPSPRSTAGASAAASI